MTKSGNKTKANSESVSDFLNSIQDDQKKKDSIKIVKLIESLTSEKATLWGTSIIGFGNYHYKYASGREGDFMKVGFSPRKQNLTFYIMPGFKRFDLLMGKLGKFKTGKSCLYIKSLNDIDLNVLEDLILSSYNYMTQKHS